MPRRSPPPFYPPMFRRTIGARTPQRHPGDPIGEPIGELVTGAVMATTAILAVFGVSWGDVASAVVNLFRPEPRNYRGLTKRGEAAQQVVDRYVVADHDWEFTDTATVERIAGEADRVVGPALGSIIRTYWYEVKQPRLAKETHDQTLTFGDAQAPGDPSRGLTAHWQYSTTPPKAPAAPVMVRAGGLALASRLADVAPVTPYTAAPAAAVAPAQVATTVAPAAATSSTTAVVAAGGAGLLGLLLVSLLRR